MQKLKVQELVGEFPDDVDLDALIERLYLMRKIERGEEQLAAGEGIAHGDVKQRLARCFA